MLCCILYVGKNLLAMQLMADFRLSNFVVILELVKTVNLKRQNYKIQSLDSMPVMQQRI